MAEQIATCARCGAQDYVHNMAESWDERGHLYFCHADDGWSWGYVRVPDWALSCYQRDNIDQARAMGPHPLLP